MGTFWDKVTRFFPAAAKEIREEFFTDDADTSDFLQGGAVIGGMIGGLAGAALGTAAFAGALFGAPLMTLGLMAAGGTLLLPVVGAAALGTLGAGIGYAGAYAVRTGVVALCIASCIALAAALLPAVGLGSVIYEVTPRRTKDFFLEGAKWGGAAGAVLGLATGVAAFVAAPAVGAALSIFSLTAGSAVLVAGAAGLLWLPVSAALELRDRLQGKDGSLNTRQESDVADAVTLRNERLGREDQLENNAGPGWMPHLAEAVPAGIYARLSDKGKLKVLEDIFGERAKGLSDYDRDSKDPAARKKLSPVFDRFARDARNILSAEESRRNALSAGKRKDEDRVSRGLDAALQNPENRVIRGFFGEVLRRY